MEAPSRGLSTASARGFAVPRSSLPPEGHELPLVSELRPAARGSELLASGGSGCRLAGPASLPHWARCGGEPGAEEVRDLLRASKPRRILVVDPLHGPVFYVPPLLVVLINEARRASGQEPSPWAIGPLAIVWIVGLLGLLLPTIAVTVRRLHDANYSGWLYLIALIPYLGGRPC